MTYDELLIKYDDLRIEEIDFSPIDPEEEVSGLYANGKIFIRNDLPTSIEKACTLIEEVGHHYTSAGNILDQRKIENRKQEKRARAWAYERMIPLASLLEAYWAGVKSRHELAEFLEVTESFLQEALNYYRDKHGIYYIIDNYIINFDPLMVCETFDTKG